MIRLMAVSVMAGHRTATATVRDYYHSPTAEGEFIRDFLFGDRKLFITQWFGGGETAASMLVNAHVELALAADEAARRAGSAA